MHNILQSFKEIFDTLKELHYQSVIRIQCMQLTVIFTLYILRLWVNVSFPIIYYTVCPVQSALKLACKTYCIYHSLFLYLSLYMSFSFFVTLFFYFEHYVHVSFNECIFQVIYQRKNVFITFSNPKIKSFPSVYFDLGSALHDFNDCSSKLTRANSGLEL